MPDSSTQRAFADALRRRRDRGGPAVLPPADAVRDGLPLAVLDGVLAETGLSADALGRVLDVSPRTLQRRRAAGARLSPAESDRLWRLLHALALARRAFADDASAREWLTTPKALLGGETPLDRLDTEPGLREVEDMLTVVDETGAA